ncbi:uncharacterized protein LOC143185402 [Calliopsis andreniformis]|uniref:uncharacterized protein LOC143185402 n=1 Tax=Calliopsis andreniformis TaxID=337506 RepID=UPI003FCE0DAC
MSTYSRRMSLRESFMEVLAKKSVTKTRSDKLKGLYLFRATVRLVLRMIDWFKEIPTDEEIKDEIALNIEKLQEKKVEKKSLTLEDRSILSTSIENRTLTEKIYLFDLFNKFHVFKKYPNHLRKRLADICIYQYLQPGRVIIKQNREAENLYFIINGECSVSRKVTDRWTGEVQKIDMGTLMPGDIFGEIALLHKIPRTATVVSKTTVDLILIPREDFDIILRNTLVSEWDVLQDALVHFNYFKSWDEETIRECCILSRMKDFEPDEVLLGDGKGMINYVHFVMDGECCLIEHMLVREQFLVNDVQYELYDPEDIAENEKRKTSSVKSERRRSSVKITEENLEELEYEYEATRGAGSKVSHHESVDYSQYLSKAIDRHTDFERASIITTTLLDVINEWHNITDVAEMLMREPSSISQQCYPTDVRTIFMQICTYTRGACFGLGENMLNRRIVTTTPVRCFLVPRYWLNKYNRANIWERVKFFMDSKFPSKKELFKKFVENRRWLRYKENLVDTIGKRGRRIRSNVTVHDVPYSIRIINDVGM